MAKGWSRPSVAAPNRLRGRRLQRLRAQVFAEQPLCAICDAKGRVSRSSELDHIVPLSKGGTDDRGNLQGLCVECHQAKSIRETGRRPRASYSRAVGVDGWPLDPRHPFHPGRK